MNYRSLRRGPGLRAMLAVLTVTGLLIASLPVRAECTAPSRPQLPQAEVPSKEMMLAAQQALKRFQSGNMRYMQCLEKEYAQARAAEAGRNRLTSASAAQRRYDEALTAAVSAEAEVTDAYNAALRRYRKARSR